jgi:kynurenine/2-aminoadipate aminotransferase
VRPITADATLLLQITKEHQRFASNDETEGPTAIHGLPSNHRMKRWCLLSRRGATFLRLEPRRRVGAEHVFSAQVQRGFSSKITDFTPHLSEISQRRQPSAIRKLMPLTKQPGMVSLGGGMPNPSTFPFESLEFGIRNPISDTSKKLSLMPKELNEALQYSATPGIPKFQQQLKELQRRNHGIGTNEEYDVTVTCGSQDGQCKVFELLLNPQTDELFVEDPTYSGALAFLQPFGVKMTPIATDSNGMIPEAFAEALEKSSARKHRKVLYTIPTAQNPSGSTLPNDRREEIYQLAQSNDMIIMEDDPYYFLHPHRSSVTSFLEMDTDGRVLRFDSLSKLISSGIRIGFVTGPSELMERLNFHIQATNLHNSGISQMLVQKLLDNWGMEGFDQHAQNVADFYVERGQVMAAAAERHLKGLATWSVPEAGMFLWFQLNGIADTKSLIENKAAKANVLLVPGQAFSPLNQPSSYARASFSTATNEEMELAMERFASLIRSERQA